MILKTLDQVKVREREPRPLWVVYGSGDEWHYGLTDFKTLREWRERRKSRTYGHPAGVFAEEENAITATKARL